MTIQEKMSRETLLKLYSKIDCKVFAFFDFFPTPVWHHETMKMILTRWKISSHCFLAIFLNFCIQELHLFHTTPFVISTYVVLVWMQWIPQPPLNHSIYVSTLKLPGKKNFWMRLLNFTSSGRIETHKLKNQ